MSLVFRVAAVLAGILVGSLGVSGANAVPAAAGRGPAKVADVVQPQPAAVTEDDDAATCSRSRKRLWVEGEGWIVRRITICR